MNNVESAGQFEVRLSKLMVLLFGFLFALVPCEVIRMDVKSNKPSAMGDAD
jgi:hypothetical protein